MIISCLLLSLEELGAGLRGGREVAGGRAGREVGGLPARHADVRLRALQGLARLLPGAAVRVLAGPVVLQLLPDRLLRSEILLLALRGGVGSVRPSVYDGGDIRRGRYVLRAK